MAATLLALILLASLLVRVPLGADKMAKKGSQELAAELQKLPALPEKVAAAKASELPADQARRLNAAVPFDDGEVTPASAFRFGGSATDRSRAIDCLALAAMAEAGGSDVGQRAVIQVVLNRVRHPAFPKSVCGVIFQGAERTSGCQFTFTCDGSLSRSYSPTAWNAARGRAEQALNGDVFAHVGTATHYHTDWVYPYWSSSLIKLARVETHLFFRWPGYWGSGAALQAEYSGGEPAIRPLADSQHHILAPAVPEVEGERDDVGSRTEVSEIVVRSGDGGAFVHLSPNASAEEARALGRSICGERRSCKVFGWNERHAIPADYPVPPAARAKLSFSYFREPNGNEIVLYDCVQFLGLNHDSCIPRAIRAEAASTTPSGQPNPLPLAAEVSSAAAQ